jgi:hypothetical protein
MVRTKHCNTMRPSRTDRFSRVSIVVSPDPDEVVLHRPLSSRRYRDFSAFRSTFAVSPFTSTVVPKGSDASARRRRI